ncbi:MAG: decarboxylase [Betaproteobacteria bacterium]|nr:MAG: decarboxylase [Betaproteobacteria bacterium]
MAPGLIERLFRTRGARDAAALRRLHETCNMLLSERGAANSAKFAALAIERYSALGDDARAAFFGLLAERFGPDAERVLACARGYAEERSAGNLARLFEAVEPPRQELLRRINLGPHGTAALVRMRVDLLKAMKSQPALAAVDADFTHLFGSWFSPGFLELVRVDWKSPASLLEQIIRHEAVHAVRDWDDLRRRLEPDRRCFAFLHPALPGELLIFVEVALLDEMPDSIAPLIEDHAVDAGGSRARCAVFYSISNCQPGLRGVSLGNFLIKRVCEILRRENPDVRRYCTLSPMPGFAAWLRSGAPLDPQRTPRGAAAHLERARDAVRAALESGLLAADAGLLENLEPAPREALEQLAVCYLYATRDTDPASDPVAKFHLNNGARIERLNLLANRSRRGLAESFGTMVNYVYDLERIEDYHEGFVNGRVAVSRALLRRA